MKSFARLHSGITRVKRTNPDVQTYTNRKGDALFLPAENVHWLDERKVGNGRNAGLGTDCPTLTPGLDAHCTYLFSQQGIGGWHNST